MPTDATSLGTPARAEPAEPKRKVDLIAPLLIPDTVAAALAGVSRAHWQRLRSAGKLPPSIKLGRKVLWRRLEIEEWIATGCPDAKVWAAMQAAAGRRLKMN